MCNGIDDDCDGVIDDGDPGGGNACGTNCGVGVTECVNGQIVCTGGNMSMPEVCNGIDDDCDGMVDEDVGTMGPCTENGTLCVPGTLECVAGGWLCVGGVPPELETCDCLDNDCDGSVDEQVPNPLCSAGATCLGQPHCVCARPCDTGEFLQCPNGYVCTNPDDPANGFCVPDLCNGVSCNPGEACDTQTGNCVPVCDTVTCDQPLVCRPSDGACVQDNCNGFPERCTSAELCLNGTCIPNPCENVSCGGNQFCRGGTCVDSCSGIGCPPNQSCDTGQCVDDPCDGVSCGPNQVCDPSTSTCTQNECIGASCGSGQICDPTTGDCVRDPCLGIVCPGAPGEQVCQGGNCYDTSELEPDAGPQTLILAGGGGCGCRVGAPARANGAWLLLALASVLAAFGARRKRQ